MKNLAIILAGGTGTRCNDPLPKQFRLIAGRSLLEICLEAFQGHPGLDGVLLVCPTAHLDRAEKTVAAGRFSKVLKVVAGGITRQESSAIGVYAAPAQTENVLIHDAARALVPAGVISRVLEALGSGRAVMPVLPASDTTVRVDNAGSVTAILDRGKLRRAQTPQGFSLAVIRQAHEMARTEGYRDASDDCSLVLRYGLAQVATVEGDVANIKVTVPLDLVIAESILKSSCWSADGEGIIKLKHHFSS